MEHITKIAGSFQGNVGLSGRSANSGQNLRHDETEQKVSIGVTRPWARGWGLNGRSALNCEPGVGKVGSNAIRKQGWFSAARNNISRANIGKEFFQGRNWELHGLENVNKRFIATIKSCQHLLGHRVKGSLNVYENQTQGNATVSRIALPQARLQVEWFNGQPFASAKLQRLSNFACSFLQPWTPCLGNGSGNGGFQEDGTITRHLVCGQLALVQWH